jgi:hypothetical protein
LTLIDRADSLFSRFARVSRADKSGKVDCICCGKPFHWGGVDPAHLVGRSCMDLRWELDNVWPCCRACHDSPDHLDRYKATLAKARGQAFVDDLIARGKRYCKNPTKAEIEEIIEQLTYKLSQYGDQKSDG